MSPSQDTGRDTIVDLSDIRKRRSDRNHPKRLAVLMVEDDEVDATLIEMALQKSTWFAVEVTRARTLSEAQDMCRVANFDLMLLDYWLGNQSALTLLDALGGRRGRLPVVLLTGLINEDVQRLGHNAGAMSFLSKDDVSANTLDAVIRSTLHSHALETELHDTIVRRDEELRAQIDAFATITRDVERPLLRIDEAAAEIARSDGTAAEAARRIHNEVGKLRDVVRMLLDEVRADRQTVELRLEPLDLAEVVDKSLRLIGNGLAELKLSARVTKPDTSVIVIMDETAMLQALLNVLSNAIAFSPRGAGIDITIATAGEDDAADVFDAMTAIAGSVPDGPHAVVTVADRGPGMRPEAIDRLVDRSGGGRDETQRKGLGLSIVAAIVRQHGGHLAIAGRDGAGTRVRICLPLGDDRPLAE